MDDERIEEAVNEAAMAFWSEVAAQVPEIKTGDLSPEDADAFRKSARRVVERWLEMNAPEAVEEG